MEEFEERLKEAEELIDEGKFDEAGGIFCAMWNGDLFPGEKSILELRIGAYFYDLGVKKIKDPIYCGGQAEKFLNSVISLNFISDTTKALEILPLVCQNLLQDYQEAVRFAKMAVDKANLKDKPEVLNREGLIERNAGLFESLETFSKAHSAAQEIKNFKEAGNALFNKAETLKGISNKIGIAKEALINGIEILFSDALSLYEEHERRTGETLEILKNNVEEKIRGLTVLVR